MDVNGLDLDDWYDVEHEELCRNAGLYHNMREIAADHMFAGYCRAAV